MKKRETRALTSKYNFKIVKSKRSVSPVIATILLVVIVIILAIIIFLWATKFIQESITKKDSPVEQMCGEVNLEVKYAGSDLQVTNIGTVYVYRVDVIKISGGDEDKDPDNALGKLGMGMSEIKNIGSGYDEIKVVPVILGETDDNKKKAYTCKNNVFVAG